MGWYLSGGEITSCVEMSFNFINSSTGYMTGFSVFKTTNSGFSWNENAFSNVPQNGIIFNNNIIYLINQVLYTYHPSIYYSNNFGANLKTNSRIF